MRRRSSRRWATTTRARRAAWNRSRLRSLWAQGNAQVRRSIAAVRGSWLDDVTAADLIAKYGLDWAAGFEAREIQTCWCGVHGDLHGENVLVSADDRSVVIDYGDVSAGLPATIRSRSR
jgi:Ser/Thr protein kinase RdoA (MazF antagonist)